MGQLPAPLGTGEGRLAESPVNEHEQGQEGYRSVEGKKDGDMRRMDSSRSHVSQRPREQSVREEDDSDETVRESLDSSGSDDEEDERKPHLYLFSSRMKH